MSIRDKKKVQEQLVPASIVFSLLFVSGPIGRFIMNPVYKDAKSIAAKFIGKNNSLYEEVTIPYTLIMVAIVTYIYIKFIKRMIEERRYKALRNFTSIEGLYCVFYIRYLALSSLRSLRFWIIMVVCGIFLSQTQYRYAKRALKSRI